MGSAGTHVVGGGSAALKSGRVPRITGLDPGRYPTYNSDIELDITDADFVEIVHTNGGTDLDDRAIFDAIGHVDFYANGGHHQPGCEDSSGLFSLQSLQSSPYCGFVCRVHKQSIRIQITA